MNDRMASDDDIMMITIFRSSNLSEYHSHKISLFSMGVTSQGFNEILRNDGHELEIVCDP